MAIMSALGRRHRVSRSGALAALLALALFISAPFVHGLLHPDHIIEVALEDHDRDHPDAPGSPLDKSHDCALFLAYVGHTLAHAVADFTIAAPLRLSTEAPRGWSALLSAGTPHGIARSRGPPSQA